MTVSRPRSTEEAGMIGRRIVEQMGLLVESSIPNKRGCES
jgi:hypothetical protein